MISLASPKHRRVSLIALLLALGAGSIALPCNTPVNRYALYRWEASPYYIFHVRHGEDGPATSPLAKPVEKLWTHRDLETTGEAASIRAVTNLEVVTLDASKPDDLADLPPHLRQSLEEEPADSFPLHLIVNPRGREVYRGELKMADVAGLADSPTRQEIARLLDAGHDGVLVFLESADAEANARALKEIDRALEMVAPAEGADEKAAEKKPVDSLDELIQGDDELSDSALRVGKVILKPDDAREKWFLRMLYACEELEPEDLKQPMVFAAYGRGRIMEPYLGAGIIAENLLDVIRFINGPCSCQVKDENPGVDLLTTWNWEKTAMKIAREIGEETGNEHLLGEELVWDITATKPVEKDQGTGGEASGAESAPASPPVETIARAEVIEAPESVATGDTVEPAAAEKPSSEADPAPTSPPGEAPATPGEPTAPAPPTESFEGDAGKEADGSGLSNLPVLLILIIVAGGFLVVATIVLITGKR